MTIPHGISALLTLKWHSTPEGKIKALTWRWRTLRPRVPWSPRIASIRLSLLLCSALAQQKIMAAAAQPKNHCELLNSFLLGLSQTTCLCLNPFYLPSPPPPPPPPPPLRTIACVQIRLVGIYTTLSECGKCASTAPAYLSAVAQLLISQSAGSPRQLLVCANAGLILVGSPSGIHHQDHPDRLCRCGSASPLPCAAPPSPCCREAAPHRPGL